MSFFNRIRKLTKLELSDLQELARLVRGEEFKLIQIKGNTALFNNGQRILANQEALVTLLRNAQRQHISRLLNQLGYAPETNVNVNMLTGEIKVVKQTNPELKNAT